MSNKFEQSGQGESTPEQVSEKREFKESLIPAGKMEKYARERVDRHYDDSKGVGMLEISLERSDGGIDSMILEGKIIKEEGSNIDHLDEATVKGQLNGTLLSQEDALKYWKKFFPIEGLRMVKVAEWDAAESEPHPQYDLLKDF